MTKIITPQKNRVSVSVPQEYIGKPIAITMVLVSTGKEVKPKQSVYEAAAACNATSVDAFFDEVDNRIKNRFLNV